MAPLEEIEQNNRTAVQNENWTAEHGVGEELGKGAVQECSLGGPYQQERGQVWAVQMKSEPSFLGEDSSQGETERMAPS